MYLLEKIITGSGAAFLLLVCLVGVVYGQGTGGSIPFGGELRGTFVIRGKLLCARCSIQEVSEAEFDRRRLIELRHAQGQIVIEVSWVSEPQRWSYVDTRNLAMRAENRVFQLLTAEENMFKEIELLTLLRTTGTIDVFRVKFRGQPDSP